MNVNLRISFVVCLALTVLGQLSERETIAAPAKHDESSDLMEMLGNEAENDNHEDKILAEKVFYSGLCDRWIKAYIQDKPAEADRIWAQILSQVKGSEQIYTLIAKLFDRLSLMAPDNARNDSKYGVLPYTKRLLAATEATLGKEHQYVSDILGFMGNHYLSIGDFQTALTISRRAQEIAKKSAGPESEITGFCDLDVAYSLCRLGRLTEAQPIIEHVKVMAKKHKYDRLIPQATRLENQIRSAMQKRGHTAQVERKIVSPAANH